MNPESSKTSNPKKLLLSLPHINLKSRDKYAALSNLNIYYRWKNIKKSYRNNELKLRTINLSYLMNHILSWIFNILFSTSSRNMKLIILQ